jgi:hypothetical protein
MPNKGRRAKTASGMNKQLWQAVSRLSCKTGRDMSHTKLGLKDINALIDWKLDKYLAAKAAKAEGRMQDMITIECRVDFADQDKIPELIKIACSMARTLVANVNLLGPTTKPECVIWSDNFMLPPEKINIYADLIEGGNAQLVYAGAGDTATVTAEESLSDELLAAMK